jgi:hypothetical protein
MLKLFLIIISIYKTTESIINIENIYNVQNDGESDNTTISKYLQDTPMIFYKYPRVNKSNEILITSLAINTNVTYTFSQTESDGIVINDLSITKDNQILQPAIDYIITSNISNEVLPQNYFYNTFYSCGDCQNLKVNCSYQNFGPSYTQGTFKNFNLGRLVSFKNLNFGINSTIPGIQVLNVYNLTTTQSTFDIFLKQYGIMNMPTDNIWFRQIHASTPQFETYDYLIGESVEGELHIYRMTDNPPQVEHYSTVNYSIFNMTDAIQVDIYNGNIIMGGDEGFVVAKMVNNNWTIIFNNKGLKVQDFIANNKTVYVIEKNFGMRIFDLITLKFTKFEFQHPGLTKFDYFLDSLRRIYYVGITVDNNPPMINEVLIELIVHPEDEMEYTPHINKVYTSNNKYNSRQIVTDQFYGFTYFYNNIDLKVYIVTRYIIEKYNLYSYQIDLKDYLTTNFPSLAPINTAYIVSNDYDLKKGVLLLQNYNDYLVISEFSSPSYNYVNCVFAVQGNYSITIPSEAGCAGYNLDVPQEVEKCRKNFVWQINVQEGNKTLLFAILAFIIVICLLVIIGVVCYRTGCLKSGGKKGNAKYGSKYIEAGVIEVKVDQMNT